MKPTKEERHVAAEFTSVCLRLGTEHTIAVGVRREQNLNDVEFGGLPDNLCGPG
jgi:hypothetical protein